MKKILAIFLINLLSLSEFGSVIRAQDLNDPTTVHHQIGSQNFKPESKDTAYDSLWGLQVSHVSEVWINSTGAGVLVAVIDSGSGPNPDLNQNLLPGRTIIRGRVSDGASDVDLIGHGTHVAGIIAAQYNNDIGIAGVAPNAQILPIRILDEKGDGSDGDLSIAVRYAADSGARVINLSLGGELQTSALQSALEYATSKGALVVAAAGNGGPNARTTYPAGNDLTLAVTAVDQTLNSPSFTQRGSYIDVSAPGISICSTNRINVVVDASRKCAGASEPYVLMSGTSMAAAFVSGVAALIFSARPDFTAQQVREVIIATAQDIGAPGRDEIFGAGLIDTYAIFKALGYFPDQIVFPSISSLGHIGQEVVGGTVQIPESERLQWYRCLTAGEATLTIPTDCSAISRAQRNIYIPTRADNNKFLRFGTLISIGGTPQLRFSETSPRMFAVWTTNTTIEKGLNISVDDFIESASAGKKSAMVISGPCKISKNVLNALDSGDCKIKISVTAKAPYSKLTRIVNLIIVPKIQAD